MGLGFALCFGLAHSYERHFDSDILATLWTDAFRTCVVYLTRKSHAVVLELFVIGAVRKLGTHNKTALALD